jgi:2-oxoglutarate ferredoxin oxidoreductase subunit beta
MDGAVLVDTLRKALKNDGFSLVHVVYPCTTNFGKNALGTRNAVKIFSWIKDHAAPLGEENEDTVWRTGIYVDASNSRPEFSQFMREKVEEIRGRYENEGAN